MVTLFYRDLGGAGKPPLVVLHGLLGSSRNWLTTGGDLAARYHVMAPDLRNHGKSPHADEMTYEAMAGDVLAWMDAQGLGRVTLMGHSMGGKTAMLLACRHPERVERLIVVDIAPKDYLSNAHRAEFAAMNELDLRMLESRAGAELKFEARVDDWGMRKFLTTNLERTEAGGWKWQINLAALTAALPAIEGKPLADGDRFAPLRNRSRQSDPAKTRIRRLQHRTPECSDAQSPPPEENLSQASRRLPTRLILKVGRDRWARRIWFILET